MMKNVSPSRVIGDTTFAPGGFASQILVTGLRRDVHCVVAEHGAVNLFGKTLRQRAEALDFYRPPGRQRRPAAEVAETRSIVVK